MDGTYGNTTRRTRSVRFTREIRGGSETRSANKTRDMRLTGAEPSYTPKDWDEIEPTHNCYAYAHNAKKDRRINFPQPGHFGAGHYPRIHDDMDMTCDTFHQRVLMDNPHIYPIAHGKRCARGHYKVFLAVSPNEDYHWYRQDADGLYSHKPGATPVRRTNSAGRRITDPLYSDRLTSAKERSSRNELYYMNMCNAYCVPKNNTFIE